MITATRYSRVSPFSAVTSTTTVVPTGSRAMAALAWVSVTAARAPLRLPAFTVALPVSVTVGVTRTWVMPDVASTT